MGSGGAQVSSGGAIGSSGGANGNSGGAIGSSGGANGTGGAGETGGAGPGSGGAGPGSGGAGPATGGSTGSGGRTNTGGSSAGGSTSGSGGSGVGGGAGGGSGGLPTVATLFPAMGNLGSLDGRLALMPCIEDNGGGTDCKPGGFYTTAGSTAAPTRFDCQGSSFLLDQVFPVGGEVGKIYTVTIHIYGIAEPKIYDGTGVMRDAGNGRPGVQDTGSSPTPWATAPGGHTFTASDYNSAEIRSCSTRACARTDETNVYYLNADTQQGHWTFVMNYEKQIKVTGGGSVRVRNYDRNCRQIKNCGMNGTPNDQCATVANARKINVSAAMPAPAMSAATMGGLLQPNLTSDRGAGNSGQWLLIDVVKVDSVM